MNLLNMPLTQIKGIGDKKAKEFNRIGILSVYDLLETLPSRYEDRETLSYIENLVIGESVCIRARILSAVKVLRIRKNLTICKVTAADDSGSISLCWYNNKYIDRAIKQDNEYVFYGKVSKGKSGIEITNPVFESVEKEGTFTGKIIPVYRGIYPISQKQYVKTVAEAIELSKNMFFSALPESVEKNYNIMSAEDALLNIHFPTTEQMLVKARERYAFETFFRFQTAMRMLRNKSKEEGLIFPDVSTKEMEDALPFKLTDAQKRTIEEIKCDLTSQKVSKRLIQGDVGSGKTIIAVLLAYVTVKNGFQCAVMAPTEILAKQHERVFKSFLGSVKVKCLTSSITRKEKEQILKELKDGEIDVLIGTHALIEPDVVFKRLGYVICDEQHRFGVNQRMKLIEKGENPHLAVMTATPIPRTLSLVLYGDLKPSIIDMLPPGRQKIKTYLLNEALRERAYNFIREQIKDGGQAYIVCPLVEESDKSDIKSAEEFKKQIENEFSDINVGLLHGKLKDSLKNEIMTEFKEGRIQILVSTTVVEVGVDVPNASIMVIENAERFGLSQLHQLRGRVGRGNRQSYCFMFAKTGNQKTLERLRVIESSNDGFYISEQDLKQRGPGDFFGTKQSGLPEMKGLVGELDMDIMYKAVNAVEKLERKELVITSDERKILNYFVKKQYFEENIKNILN